MALISSFQLSKSKSGDGMFMVYLRYVKSNFDYFFHAVSCCCKSFFCKAFMPFLPLPFPTRLIPPLDFFRCAASLIALPCESIRISFLIKSDSSLVPSDNVIMSCPRSLLDSWFLVGPSHLQNSLNRFATLGLEITNDTCGVRLSQDHTCSMKHLCWSFPRLG